MLPPGIGTEYVKVSVNNAVIAEYSADLVAAPRAGIEPMAVNIRGPFLINETLYLRLRASRSFRIRAV